MKKSIIETSVYFNKKKFSDITYVDGVTFGLATWWYLNGALWQFSTFKKGKMHGVNISFKY